LFHDETQFVAWLQAQASGRASTLRLGIGDDAAVVEGPPGWDYLLKTDMSIEDVHFTAALHPPLAVGHRALARPLSDIAAMGGRPRFALVALAVSKRAPHGWIKRLYAGIFTLARRFGVMVVGGDTAIVEGKTFIDVVVVGEVRRGRAIRRSGARPGDQVYVSGRLGLAELGLRVLGTQGGGQPGEWRRLKAAAVSAHLYPEPRSGLGRYLSGKRLASALIDVSDGLSTDLAHLCGASGVGARVWADRIPAPTLGSTRVAATQALELALHGGEDYELLFTVRPGKANRVPSRFRGIRINRIGEIEKTRRLLLIGADGKPAPLRPAGYDHFRK